MAAIIVFQERDWSLELVFFISSFLVPIMVLPVNLKLAAPLSGHFCLAIPSLQLGQNSFSTADGDTADRLLLSVDDLAVVNDQGIARSAFTLGPAQSLRESSAGVGEEELLRGTTVSQGAQRMRRSPPIGFYISMQGTLAIVEIQRKYVQGSHP